MLTAAITCVCFAASFFLVVAAVEKLLDFNRRHKK
jgi:hypothetical protein